MNKKLLLLTFIISALVVGACGFNININVDEGSGNVITETRNVSGFDRVQFSGIGDVELVQGDREELVIEAEDNVLSRITTEVRGGTLYIGFDRRPIFPTKTVKFYLTMRDIRGLETTGVSNIQAENVVTDRLEIRISGTGNTNIYQLTTDRLNVNISGAGSFTAQGETQEQTINLSGAGNFNGFDLASQNANVTITGLGKVTLWVVDRLDVTISGAGEVDYYGSPQINQQISGLGNLKRLGNK
jgi:hypothetical protein